MRNSEKLYNTKYKLIQTTSDLCAFIYPKYEVENFDLIQPVTLESLNVFLVEGPIDMPVNLTFTENLESLTGTTKYNYQIVPYIHQSEIFASTGDYISPVYDYVEPEHSSVFNTIELIGEGEYLFKLGFQFDACTFIADLIGKRYVANTFNNMLPYGNYDENNDKYFILLYKADEPRIDVGVVAPVDENGDGIADSDILINRPLAVQTGVATYTLDIGSTGEVIITLNGHTLQSGVNNDYTLVGNILTFSEPLVQEDMVNYIFIGKSGNSSLKSETIEITSFITQGPTDGEGNNEVYYNTDKERYEVYTDYRIKNKDSLVITINGVTLSNGIDYYVSTTNSKRIILEGDLMVGDVIIILYDSGENLARTITQDYIDINWYVINEIWQENGEFIIEFATDEAFFNIVQTEVVGYQINVLNYTKRVSMNYSYGQVLFYRIRNVKTYTTIVGSELVTDNVSAIVRIEIKTNISNNY